MKAILDYINETATSGLKPTKPAYNGTFGSVTHRHRAREVSSGGAHSGCEPLRSHNSYGDRIEEIVGSVGLWSTLQGSCVSGIN